MIGRVALIGLMGTGKSTIGIEVARHLGWTFVDIDDRIVAATGRTVRQLSEELGEDGYRSIEDAAAVEALEEPDRSVVAVPAGSVLRPEVARLLVAPSTLTIWLRAEPGTLARRVRAGDHRPLLGTDPLPVLTRMAAERDDRYRTLASETLVVDGRSVADVVVAAVAVVDGRGVGGSLASG